MRDDKFLMNELQTKPKTFDTQEKIMAHPWKLKSIYETGLVPDMAQYKDVEIVFGPLRIYAIYGNRAERFDYRFVSPRIFTVKINGDTVKCRISKLTDRQLHFYADYKDGHYLVEMER